MIGTIAVLMFLGVDLAVVICALLFLSTRRAQSDITDMRYRGRHRRRSL